MHDSADRGWIGHADDVLTASLSSTHTEHPHGHAAAAGAGAHHAGRTGRHPPDRDRYVEHMYTNTTPRERCNPPDPFITHRAAHTKKTGALWYDPTKQLRPGPPPKYTFKPEARPLPKPGPTKGERYNLAEVLQLSSTW